MTFKSKDKSFFDEIYSDIKEPIEDKKEEIEKKGKRKFLKFYDFGTSRLRNEIKRRPAQYFFLFLTSFLGSVITSSVALFIFTGNVITKFAPKPEEQVMSATAQVENEKKEIEKYDPLLLASKLKKGDNDFLLIDIRSKEDYEKGHIVNAVNLPVFGTVLMSESGTLNKEGIEKALTGIIQGDKIVILYGQNAYSTTPTTIANLLIGQYPNIKPLAIGFDEWAFLNQ